MKKRIFHIIDSLAIGGAEQLLVGIIPSLKQFENIIITLKPLNDYQKQLEGIEIISLDYDNRKASLPSTIFRLKKLIRHYKPSIIHTHLFWSTIIGRLACPKSVKLITTYHSLLYDPNNKAQYSKKMVWLDKLTYKKRYYTIYISNGVKNIISNAIGIKENHSVIYNYVIDEFYTTNSPKLDNLSPIKAVSVGNFRLEKDYPTAIRGVGKFSSDQITLDIFGDGKLRKEFEEIISTENITNVNLKGRSNQISELLSHYDLFIMASKFEGFGIALAEAMAIGLPCLVSDIDVFKEVAKEASFYFQTENVEDLSKQINQIISNPKLLLSQGNKSKELSQKYSLSNYLNQLNNIYNESI